MLGAAGLIGDGLARGLADRGHRVVPLARRFSTAQAEIWGPEALVAPLVDLGIEALRHLLAATRAEVIVNCIGVLQDGPNGRTDDVHGGFVDRLIAALRGMERPPFLVHLSIPGRESEDHTGFARSKRAADHAVVASGLPHVILRPGFVVAPAAYGGSALVRALAALPVALPTALAERPFAVTALDDLVVTLAWIAAERVAGRGDIGTVWDVLDDAPTTVGEVIEAFRRRFGGPRPRLRLPSVLLTLGARAGDLVARLGWSPPIRSTALAEMRRGVRGDPGPWRTATGLRASGLSAALARLPATVQEGWFARLYLLKAGVIATLALFWMLSGLLAVVPGWTASVAMSIAHGFDAATAPIFVGATALADIAIGLAIARRRSCRLGLVAALGLSALYLLGATVLAPGLWADPLGPLVKILPSMMLAGVGLAILEAR